MENKIITLPSGARLEIQMASFEKGHRLLKAVMRDIEGVDVALGADAKSFKDFMNLQINDGLLNTIKNLAARMISSDAVESALWECLKTCLYNDKHISRETFESGESREDFLLVMKEVLVYNLSPFFKNLGSLLSTLGKKTSDGQK